MIGSKIGRRPVRRPDPHTIRVLAEVGARVFNDLNVIERRQDRQRSLVTAEPTGDGE